MNRPLNVCLSVVLAQMLLAGTVQANDFIFSNGFETCFGGSLFDWDGGGDGVAWADSLNWDGDALPGDGDSISIENSDPQMVVYDDSLDASIIRCLDSQRALSVTGGSLEIIEAINVRNGVVITGGTFRVTGRLRVISDS